MNIILIGFKNSGKTSVGKRLSEILGVDFWDTDKLIEKSYGNEGKSVSDIYRIEGEEGFRKIESEVILSLNIPVSCILSTGGGVVLKENNRKFLKNLENVFYLKASLDELLKRQPQNKIPAFLDAKNFEESFIQMYDERKSLYEACANHVIDVNAKSIETICSEIKQELNYG